MLAATLPNSAQLNSYPGQREFNPFALPVYVRSAQSSLIYPVADGYQFSRPIVAPELQPQAAPTAINATSIDFEASGLYTVAQHENQSTFKLVSALTVMAHQQGKTIGNEAVTVRASLTELVVETRMAKPGVNRAIKEAIAKGYIAQTLQGNAIDGKSCYQLNLPFVVPTVAMDGHAAWSQISTHPQSSGYEQRTLDLTAETRFEATNAKNGWSQISTHPVAAPIDTNAQGQTYAQVRDSIFRDSINNINSNKTISRNNRNTESRVGESESVQAYAQEQGQTSAPVSTPVAVSTRARSSTRSRAYISDTLPMQLTLNLNITGLSGQTHTLTAAPGVTVNITPTEQAQPITDHIGEVNEMVATSVAVADTAISRGPSEAVAPDTTAVQASEVVGVGRYSYNLPVIENATEPVQPIAATVSASDNVVAASEFPKHVTSYQQLEKEQWKPRLKPKVECPARVIDEINRFSTELGNDKGKTSNATQVANIFGEAGIATDEFLVVMNKSRKLTETFAKARSGDKPGQKRNLMPYFFKVLRDQLGKYLDGKFDYDDDEDSVGSAAYSIRAGVNQPTLFATETNQDESVATDVEVELEGFSDGATTEVKPVSAAMVSAITMRDKDAGANIDVFGSRVEGDVLFAKFYKQTGPGDTSRWVSWLKPYGISRIEVI